MINCDSEVRVAHLCSSGCYKSTVQNQIGETGAPQPEKHVLEQRGKLKQRIYNLNEILSLSV